MKQKIPEVLNDSQQRRVDFIKGLIWQRYQDNGLTCSPAKVGEVYHSLEADGVFFGNQDVLHKAQLEDYTGVESQLLIRTSWDVIDPIVYAASTQESVSKQLKYEIGSRIQHFFHQ